MQDITAYVIVSVVHYLVVAVGFGLVAFLIYHDKSWISMLVATVFIERAALSEFLQQQDTCYMSLVRT